MAELTPDDFAYFNTRRRQARNTYDMSAAQNSFQRTTASNQYSRNLNNLTQQYSLLREGLPGKHAQRGTLNSGIYQNDIAQFNKNKMQSFADARAMYDEQDAGYGLAANQLAQVRAASLADLDELEAARRASVASALRGAL